MTASTKNTIVGVFVNPRSAQQTVVDLKSAGFTEKQIGILSRDEDQEKAAEAQRAGEIATDATTGAVTGASIGALWGIGILAGALPGVGPAIVGGTLGVLLSSAAAGGTMAGIGGALMGLGLNELDASFYEREFKEGRTLITVNASPMSNTAYRVIRQHGGQIREPHEVGL
jgi:hypothetical protein